MHRGFKFVFEGNAPPDLLNCIYVLTEEVNIRVFNESLQIAFPNNVLISKFHDECG